MKKRYALLHGDTYYAAPGWNSFSGWYDDVESAIKAYHEANGSEDPVSNLTWYQVLDTETFEVVASAGKSHSGLFGHIKA